MRPGNGRNRPALRCTACDDGRTSHPCQEEDRAVVASKLSGPDIGLSILDDIAGWDGGKHYYLFAAARADLLRRLRRFTEANAEYRRALALTDNAIEQAFLQDRIEETRLPNS